MSDTSLPVWFITGCSTGLGQELAKRVLQRGWRAVVTARDVQSVARLAAETGDRALALQLDVTDSSQIQRAVAAAEQRFGRIDVLVNNAGYGYQSSAEEGDEEEIRRQFDTNVFGLFAVTRAVLPGMRLRRRGHVINITSIAGFVGFPGSGYYAASKHAVEGWSDALAAEGGPLGIKVTCVEPGPFRTDWAGRSLKQTATAIEDYAATAGARLRKTASASGSQAGDPVRAAIAITGISEIAHPPRHLVLGSAGLDLVLQTLGTRMDELSRWRDTSASTDFPAAGR
jgi:NAD(P)-dependent dehydrogenase (short-subunit alcohol dehydrogenase family)